MTHLGHVNLEKSTFSVTDCWEDQTWGDIREAVLNNFIGKTNITKIQCISYINQVNWGEKSPFLKALEEVAPAIHSMKTVFLKSVYRHSDKLY